ncbi:MAG: hypothetical protein N2446_02315 [Elusimicrobiales bacterium]|nr:hypothetical protein [Elusimicrobiales bacterium]
MKKVVLMCIVFFSYDIFSYAQQRTIEFIRSEAYKIVFPKINTELPNVNLVKDINKNQPNDTNISQDLVYKFNQVKGRIFNFKNEIIWVKNDMARLLNDAKRIQITGYNNGWFSYDLRDMAYKMSRWYNDIERIRWDIKELVNIATNNDELYKISRDIELYVLDIDNTFNISLENTARDLEYTVRSIDPKIIGYDAMWNAYDISRYVREISYKLRDIYWDSRSLIEKTRPKIN